MTKRRSFILGSVIAISSTGMAGCTQNSEQTQGQDSDSSEGESSDSGEIRMTTESKDIIISRGETAEPEITFENIGDSSVNQSIKTTVNGEELGTNQIELEAGETFSQSVRFGPIADDPFLSLGENVINATTEDDEVMISITVENPPCYDKTFVVKRIVPVDASIVEFVIDNNHETEDGQFGGVYVSDVKVVRSDCVITGRSQDSIPPGEPISVERGESFRAKVNAGVGPGNIKAVKITWDSFKPGVDRDGPAGGIEDSACLAQVDNVDPAGDNCDSYDSDEGSGPFGN